MSLLQRAYMRRRRRAITRRRALSEDDGPVKSYGTVAKTCDICADAPAAKGGLPCGCKNRHCRGCLVRHLRARIRAGRVARADMRCFHAADRSRLGVLEDRVVEDLVGAEDYLKMIRFRNQNDDKLRLCPRVGCGTWTRHERAYRAGKVPCGNAACRAPICFHCGGEWRRTACGLGLCRRNAHAGGGGAAQQQRQSRCALLREHTTLALYEWCHHVKRCPQCRRIIEKTGGCRHMTCKCGFQFCWHCKRDYFRSHSKWACDAHRFCASRKWGPGPVRIVTKAVGLPVAGALGLAAGAVAIAGFAAAMPVLLWRWVREARRRRRSEAFIRYMHRVHDQAREARRVERLAGEAEGLETDDLLVMM